MVRLISHASNHLSAPCLGFTGFVLLWIALCSLILVCEDSVFLFSCFLLFFLKAISSYCTCAEVQWAQFPALDHTALELLHYVTFFQPSNSVFFQERTKSFVLISFWPRKMKAMLKQQSRQGAYCVKIPLFYWISIITIAHNQFEQSKIFIEIHWALNEQSSVFSRGFRDV